MAEMSRDPCAGGSDLRGASRAYGAAGVSDAPDMSYDAAGALGPSGALLGPARDFAELRAPARGLERGRVPEEDLELLLPVFRFPAAALRFFPPLGARLRTRPEGVPEGAFSGSASCRRRRLAR